MNLTDLENLRKQKGHPSISSLYSGGGKCNVFQLNNGEMNLSFGNLNAGNGIKDKCHNNEIGSSSCSPSSTSSSMKRWLILTYRAEFDV